MMDRTALYTIEGSDETFMETYTGKFVNPLNLKDEDIDIRDIAHHLSNICRFSGACRVHYSVGQHSLHVCRVAIAGGKNKLAALLHDAPEAYLNDVIRPIKYSLPDLQDIEYRAMSVISEHFELESADWKMIKMTDNTLIATEARDLMTSKGVKWHWPLEIHPLREKIVPQQAEEVEKYFLDAYYKYGGK